MFLMKRTSQYKTAGHLLQQAKTRTLMTLTSSALEAVDFRAASAASASALPLPLPPKRSYFISCYPTHLFGSG